MKQPPYLICKKCGWVHYGVSREFAQWSVSSFNEMYKNLSKKEKQDYYNNTPASLDTYSKCFSCGAPYIEFRAAKRTEIPKGSTIQPILLAEKKKDESNS
jgi:hypothetical protein